MMNNKLNIQHLFALFVSTLLLSCTDANNDILGDDSMDEIPTDIRNGYSLTLTVTLDHMGGTRATEVEDTEVDPMADIENYIDPEKFRVLFFNANEEFLFESKSRWVKQLADESNYLRWMVSVPFFSYGNDTRYNWDWEKIKDAVTGGDFYIAVLTNRPGQQYFAGTHDGELPADWFNNSGPFWEAKDTSWGAEDLGGTIKRIFDLHHCQWDPIYENKSRPSTSYTGEDFYDFIMGKDDKGRPSMSATVSWVDWQNTNSDGKRDFFLPNKETDPIPMYGIQKFNKIEDWKEGVPFTLSQITKDQESSDRYKSISLLRAAVKLELRLSEEPQYISLFYPNVYARCEPMDIWTPTNEIWENDHEKCEWKSIMEYGPISRNILGDVAPGSGNDKNNFDYYRKKLSWFYGSWLQKGWTFGTFDEVKDFNFANAKTPYPKILNSCVQRNTYVHCENVKVEGYHDGYVHYVVYTGERNINDPSSLTNQIGQGTVCYWVISFDKSKYYSIPIADYNVAGNPAIDLCKDPETSKPETATNKTNGYMQSIQQATDPQKYPWPLLRNHVYRLTVNKPSATRGSKGDDIEVFSEERYSQSIQFE